MRIGNNFHSYYNGNIGYEIEEIFRGKNYALKACKLVLPIAKAHGMNELFLTCDENNIPSYKTIEKLGGEVVACVYLIELAGLDGRKKLEGYRVESAICYEGK